MASNEAGHKELVNMLAEIAMREVFSTIPDLAVNGYTNYYDLYKAIRAGMYDHSQLLDEVGDEEVMSEFYNQAFVNLSDALMHVYELIMAGTVLNTVVGYTKAGEQV